MKRRSTTPWKKSRTYGDIYGGRKRRRMADNIFARAHSIQRPNLDQPIPILIQDNASREYAFPVSAQELAKALCGLPISHSDGITHIWLRRLPPHMKQVGAPLAEFICGSGVRVIVIYPWRTDGKLYVGRSKPSNHDIIPYLRFGASVVSERGLWYVRFAKAELKRFYIEYLFCHEVGHHVDYYNRRWSKANARKVEEFADQYAVQWGPYATVIPTDT